MSWSQFTLLDKLENVGSAARFITGILAGDVEGLNPKVVGDKGNSEELAAGLVGRLNAGRLAP